MQLKNKFGGMFGQLTNMMAPGMNANPEEMSDKMEQLKKVIEEVDRQFKNPVRPLPPALPISLFRFRS